MPLRLVQVNFKAADDQALGKFWADALGWDLSSEGPDVANVEPPNAPIPDPRFLGIDVVRVEDPTTVNYRARLDLATTSLSHHEQLLAHLLSLGATESGTATSDFTPLRDPAGNDFRLLAPQKYDDGTGPIAAVVLQCQSPQKVAEFWDAATDWTVVERSEQSIRMQSAQGIGPYFEFVASDPEHATQSRLHIDLRPYADDNQAAEVARLLELGAVTVDLGQGDVPWDCLADVEGNEFCVLTPH